MTSTSQNMSSTHNPGNTPTVTPSTAPKTSSYNSPSNSSDCAGVEYPEQIHAGAVGYGPNYHAGPTLADKVQGIKHELIGKLKNDPDLVQHGRDVKSGQERRKKLTGGDEPNPFIAPNKDESGPLSTDPSFNERTSSITHEVSGSPPPNVQPRHQSHPMRPASNAQSHTMHSPDTSDSPHSDDPNTVTTNPVGLNSPIGLRNGKIQTIVGTPNLAPTTASQQPAFQKDQQSNTHSQSASNNYNQQFQSQFSAGPDLTPQTLAGPLDSPFLREGGSSPSSGITGVNDGEGYEKRSYVQQGGRRGNDSPLVGYEPYRKETVGQGGDALLNLSERENRRVGQGDQNLQGKEEKLVPNVKFGDAEGHPVEQLEVEVPPVPQPRQ